MPSQAKGILVTGANGHIGRQLLHWLAERGTATAASESGSPVPTRAVVRSRRAAEALEALPEGFRPTVHVVAYDDEDGLRRAAEGCRAAVHLVGIIKQSSRSTYRAAHEGTCAVLARAAKAAGLSRIVYLSILGAAEGSDNPCLASKGRAERILLESGVDTTVIRVPMVIGRGDFASRALRGRATSRWVPLVGGGSTIEQPIDVFDVVAAICACLGRSELAGAALDLAGPEALSHRELVERAARLHAGRPYFLTIPLALARTGARLLERMSADPAITPAMLEVLQHDDRVDATTAIRALGVELTPLDETLRRCVGPEAAA